MSTFLIASHPCLYVSFNTVFFCPSYLSFSSLFLSRFRISRSRPVPVRFVSWRLANSWMVISLISLASSLCSSPWKYTNTDTGPTRTCFFQFLEEIQEAGFLPDYVFMRISGSAPGWAGFKRKILFIFHLPLLSWWLWEKTGSGLKAECLCFSDWSLYNCVSFLLFDPCCLLAFPK